MLCLIGLGIPKRADICALGWQRDEGIALGNDGVAFRQQCAQARSVVEIGVHP